MAKRIKQDTSEGPNGEIATINWMPGNRVRIDFHDCGRVVATHIFPTPKTKVTHVEFSYDKKQKSQ